MLPSMSLLMEQVVAEELRTIRTLLELSQDQFGSKMRFHGFHKWTRATVAAVETGRRRLTLGELFGVARVLEVPLWLLLLGHHDRVALAEDLETRSAVIRHMLGDALTAKDAEDFKVTMPPEVADMDRISNVQAELCMSLAPEATQQMLLRAAGGELEQIIARHYATGFGGTEPSDGWTIVVAAAAQGRYGKSATEERDARAPTPEQRQHISRTITAELIDEINQTMEAWVGEIYGRFPGRPGSKKGGGT